MVKKGAGLLEAALPCSCRCRRGKGEADVADVERKGEEERGPKRKRAADAPILLLLRAMTSSRSSPFSPRSEGRNRARRRRRSPGDWNLHRQEGSGIFSSSAFSRFYAMKETLKAIVWSTKYHQFRQETCGNFQMCENYLPKSEETCGNPDYLPNSELVRHLAVLAVSGCMFCGGSLSQNRQTILRIGVKLQTILPHSS